MRGAAGSRDLPTMQQVFVLLVAVVIGLVVAPLLATS
eukprot:COSAG05_NODE_452_length_9699_cov_33.848125_11_plen_37_part_00